MIRDKKYYLDNAAGLSWGEGTLDKERLKILKKYIKGKRILDIGCGVGVYVDYLTKAGFEGVGIDFVSEFIDKANKDKKGTFLKASADKLPFKDNSFDTVLLFDILEHGDDIKILKEAKRVTKDRVIAIVPKIVDKHLSDSGVIFRHYIDKSHLREYEIKDLNNLAKKIGLKVKHLERVQLLPNFAIFASLLRGPNILFKIIGKLIFNPFLRQNYYTEILAVLDKM